MIIIIIYLASNLAKDFISLDLILTTVIDKIIIHQDYIP